MSTWEMRNLSAREKAAFVKGYVNGVRSTVDALDDTPRDILMALADMLEDLDETEKAEQETRDVYPEAEAEA